MAEEDLIDLDAALSVAFFRNTSKITGGRTYSCAVDCFLEISYRLLLLKSKLNFHSKN